MDLVQTVRQAISYIEDNLCNDLKQEDVAKHVHVSMFHFHRMFKALTDITPNEYIKKRKLSKAAEDLSTSNTTVLEIALRYGYESQSGFEKAFYRFHQVTPGKVKKNNVELKAYHPLKISLNIEGGKTMDYKIINLEGFKMAAITREFNMDETSKDDNRDIPNFWTELSKNGGFEALMSVASERALFGLCAEADQNTSNFIYGVGVKSNDTKELTEIEIASGTYAVFKVDKLEDFGLVWESINKEFLVNSKYDRVMTPDLEYYPENKNHFAEIWLPVKEK